MYIEAERLRSKRENRKMLQIEVASHCGLSKRQYQRYEATESEPKLDHLFCLAGFFNVSILWLLGLSEQEQEVPLRPDQQAALQAYEAGDVQAFARLLRKKRGK